MSKAGRDAVIRVRGLKTQFGSHVVHEHLDLDVYRGEILGVVGGSGTGKSVLLRTITGLQTPAAGEIDVCGVDVLGRGAGRDSLDDRWGVMFQDGALFSSLTVLESIQVPMREYLDLSPKLMRELTRLKIDLVGLAPPGMFAAREVE